MNKRKFTSLVMLMMIALQVFAPSVNNVRLIASEIASSEASEQSATVSEETAEVSEQTADVEQQVSDVHEQVSDLSTSEETISEEQTSDDTEVVSDKESDQDTDQQVSDVSTEDADSESTTEVSDKQTKAIEINGDSSIITGTDAGPSDVYSGDSITNNISIAFDPSDQASGNLNPDENWDYVEITLPPELILNKDFGVEVAQDDPDVLINKKITTNPDGSTTIHFDIDQDAVNAGGQTIGITFLTSITDGIDLSKYGFTVDVYGDQGSHYSNSAEVTYHDPVKFEIKKELVDPKYAAAGEELTYEITVKTDGTGAFTLDDAPQIIDTLPGNVEYVKSDPEGVYDGKNVTWDWTQEDIDAREKTVTVTIIPDEDFYNEGDQIINNSEMKFDGKVVDTDDDTSRIYPGFFIDMPDGPVDKNGDPSTNPDGNTTAPGDEIFWHFDNINYQGNATLNDYTLTDTFPKDDDGNSLLQLNKVCYGAVDSPNTIKDVTITYIDGTTKVITADMDTNGDNCVDIPDELDIPIDGVDKIVWNYGDVKLPFVVTGAGVGTTLVDDIPEGTEIKNDLVSDFHFSPGDIENPLDICPPPLVSYENPDGTIECRADDSSNIVLTADQVYGTFNKDIESTTSDLNNLRYGDEITYRLTFGNADKSPGDLLVDGLYDVLPAGLEYVDGSMVVGSTIDDTVSDNYNTSSNIVNFNFLEGDDEPFAVKPGEQYYIEYTAKVTTKHIEELTNTAYLVSATPDLLLNGKGTQHTKEPIDFDGDGNQENVYVDSVDIEVNKAKVSIEKNITNKDKMFVPPNIDPTDSTIDYSFTFTNEKPLFSGEYYSPLENPQIIDTLPRSIVLDESSISYDFSKAPDITAGNVTVAGDPTSSPVDGENQVATFDFTGTLNPGDSITVTYSADVKEYAIAGNIENDVEYVKEDGIYFVDDSVFDDNAIGIINEIGAQSVKKSVDKTEAQVGEPIEYTVEVQNTGTMPLEDATFTDDIPHGGINGTTVNTFISQLPTAYYIPQGGSPQEVKLRYTVNYIDSSGSTQTAQLTADQFEEFVVETEIQTVTGVAVTANGILYPGDVGRLVFDVETPISGDEIAEPGDIVRNTAHFSSDPIKTDGSHGTHLSNDTNTVETEIIDREPNTYIIGDFVYYDLDNDGTYVEGFDIPVKGAILDLVDADGNVIATTQTDINGYYRFSGLAPGTYTVRKQDGYLGNTYKVYPGLEQTTTITNADDLDVDFRIVPASIIGSVYYDGYDADLTDSSYYDSKFVKPQEKTLVNYDSDVQESQIELYDNSGKLLETTTTVNGTYAFYDLKGGDYVVKSTPIITADDGTDYVLTNKSESRNVHLNKGEQVTDQDFGYILPVEVKGTVWYDVNLNDIFDSGENTDSTFNANRPSKVELLDQDGKVVETMQNDSSDGTYDFDHLLPADYDVKVTYKTTSPNPVHGLEDIPDSLFTEASDGKSSTTTDAIVASEPGSVYDKHDLGIYQNAIVSGKIYVDKNYNGTNDDSTPANGRTVNLLDADGNVVATTKTDSNGNYKFTEVDPRQTYQIEMVGSDPDLIIDQSQTTDTVIDNVSNKGYYSNSGDTTLTVLPNDEIKDIDGSVYRQGTVESLAFLDSEGNGQQNFTTYDQQLAGLTVTLTGTDGMGETVNLTDSTIASGRIKFENINPGTYDLTIAIPSGYTVTFKDVGDDATDSDIDQTGLKHFTLTSGGHKIFDGGMYEPIDLSGYVFTDTDHDGYMTSEDLAENGIAVKIYRENTLLTTVNTDSTGKFSLTDQAPGNYYVQVALPNSSYEYTIAGTNADGVIANDNTAGKTVNHLILSGESNDVDYDTGYNERTSISGKIYLDTNADLTHQASELLIDGITVTLLDEKGNTVATTTTDSNGYYEFTKLEPGDYQVVASTVNYANYENEDEDPSIQSDAQTVIFTAYSGEPRENVDGALTINGDTTHYLISDYVWEDKNYDGLQTAGEPAISSAKVSLLDAAGNPVIYADSYPGLGISSGDTATTTTDSKGNYLLIVEGSGDYQVKIEYGDDYYITDAKVGSDDKIDSDFTRDTTSTNIGTLDYTVDHDTRDIDGGYVNAGSISGTVYDDEDLNYTYNSGTDIVVPNSQVYLFKASDLTKPIATTNTDSNGFYKFDDLRSGNYVVRFETLAKHNAFWTHEADGKLILENHGQDAYRNVTLGYGEDKVEQNAGRSEQAVLGGIVFEDIIADGIYDDTEDITIPNVTVSMKNADGSQAVDNFGDALTTTTDSTGHYMFMNIEPGKYYVEFTTPSGYKETNVVVAGADSNSDNDASLNGGKYDTDLLTVAEGQSYMTLSDASLYKPITISGYYYDDMDTNSTFDASIDKPVTDKDINLVDEDGNVVDTVRANSSGYYEFTNVVPNNYHVEFDTSGYDKISELGTVDTALDNDMKQDSTTDSKRYESGNKYTVENDGAVYNLATVSGYIYEDLNNDGLFEQDTETPIITDVTLYDESGAIDTISTDGNGFYQFADLEPGTYYVTVKSPNSTYFVANKGDNSKGIGSELNADLSIDSQRLYSGDNDTTDFDGGFYRLTSISGTIFFDSNADLVMNGTEFGIPNTTVTLYDNAGNVVASGKTDSDGYYEFTDLVPGDYVVKAGDTDFGNYEQMPADYQIKSDQSTPTFTAFSNTERDQVDGAVTMGKDVYYIGDYVWEDVDYDGKQTEGELPVSSVDVDLVNSSGSVVDSMTTSTDGLYHFFAPKGDYTLKFTAPEEYHFTKQVLLSSDVDSNVIETKDNVGVTDTFTADSNNLDYDAGVRKDGNINGRVYHDKDISGTWNTGDESTEDRTVTLYDSSGNVVESKQIALTNDGTEGTYNFTDLTEGDYTIEFSDTTKRFWVPNSDGKLVYDNSSEGPATRSVTLDYGQTLNDQDAGYSNEAAIVGYIYEDNDYDGKYSRMLATPTSADIPQENVGIELLDSTGTVLDTTTTDATGRYAFTNIEPYKQYQTRIINKDDNSDSVNDYVVTKLGTADTEYDNDMSAVGTEIQTDLYNLTDSQINNLDYDGGILQLTNLSGYVYDDLEVNSTMDPTDTPLANVTAHLLDQAGNEVATTTTDGTGYYEFLNIVPGFYSVKFDLDGYEVSPLGTTNTALDSDIDSSYQTATIDVKSQKGNTVSFDAGVYHLVEIGGTVFTDGDADGVLTRADEAGLGGYAVTLYDGAGNKLSNTTTASDGSYSFKDLMPGTYSVSVDPQDNLISPITSSGKDANDLKQDGTTASQFVPSSTTNYNDYDAGLYKLTAISGKIYLDTNADLTRQDGEFLIPNITVTLTDSSGKVVATTTTDSNGYYEFTDLTPGDYNVSVSGVDYAHYENEDEVPSIQSDAQTGIFTAISDTPTEHVDGALTIGDDDHHFIISDYAWEDINYDGIQDATEPVMAGVKVRLLDAAGNKLTYKDSYPGLGITAGDPVETTTDSNGNYMLIAEDNADYIVEMEANSDYFATGIDTTSDDLDNDFTGVAGGTNVGQYPYHADHDTLDVDGGYSEVGTIAGNVYDDENLDFMYETGTDIDIADSEVRLFKADNLSTPFMTTTTDSKGYYEFKDLQAGDYVVRFENLSLVEGFWTKEADGSLILDNKGNDAHRNVTIGYGEDKLHENAGRSDYLMFSGFTFEDMIADGKYDPKEDKFIPDVSVSMHNVDGSQAVDTNDDNLATTTDSKGGYMLSRIIPDHYYVQIDTPTGYEPTNIIPPRAEENINNDILNNKTQELPLVEHRMYENWGDGAFYKPVTIEGNFYEDANNDGKYQATTDTLLDGKTVELIDSKGNVVDTVTTDSVGHYVFTDVRPGYYQVQFDTTGYDAVSILGDSLTEFDNDIDSSGITKQGRYVSGKDYTVENDAAVYNYAKLSGYAYTDNNNDGYFEQNSEDPIQTKVTLYNLAGEVAKTTTDSNGYYEFDNLDPNKYYVQIDKPDNYHVAKRGSNKLGLASDINKNFQTNEQKLLSGDYDDINYDGGFYQMSAISGTIFYDSDANLKEEGSEFGIWSIPVELYSVEDGNTRTESITPVATTNTDSDGNYRFDNVVPGDYIVKAGDTYFGTYEQMPENYQIHASEQTSPFTVYSGVERDGVDGAVTRGAGIMYIGDYVWEDVNFNGKQDDSETPYAGATIELLDSTGKVVDTTTTDSDGYYDFFAASGNYQVRMTVADNYHFTKNVSGDLVNSDVVETDTNIGTTETFDATVNRRDIDGGIRLDGSISGNVYYDKDASGSWTDGDRSREVRTVSLYKGKQLIETQDIDTKDNGSYLFDNLTEGDYHLEFSDETNRFWIANQDGQLNFNNKKEGPATRDVTVGYGEHVTDQDAGYAYGAAISGYVFEDIDYNGKFNKYVKRLADTDNPLPNVEARLLNSDGKVVAKTTTDSDGHYGFTNLEPGKAYQVRFVNPDKKYTITPTATSHKRYHNDLTDSFTTELVTLNDNQVNDLDFDAGLLNRVEIGGYAYVDNNVDSTYNSGDKFLSDIDVNLLDSEGQTVAKTTTNSKGYYEFTGLAAGSYQTVFAISGYEVSPKGQASTRYENDINSSMMTKLKNVISGTSDKVSFDAAVYQPKDTTTPSKDDDSLNGGIENANGEYSETTDGGKGQMSLGHTGGIYLLIAIILVLILVILVILKKRLK